MAFLPERFRGLRHQRGHDTVILDLPSYAQRSSVIKLLELGNHGKHETPIITTTPKLCHVTDPSQRIHLPEISVTL